MDLFQDLHVHSSEYSSDSISSLSENIAAADAQGLSVIGLVDHVRADSTWLSERVEQFSIIKIPQDLEVLLGVEAKMLNTSGALDLPGSLDGVNFVAIADHRFPSETGPLDPRLVKQMINNGDLGAEEALECILAATFNSLAQVARLPYPPILVHFLSLLPKLGLVEEMVTDRNLQRLGEALITSGALLEVNEKWNCPSSYVVAYLAANGVPLVAGSDAHSSTQIGNFSRVRDLLPTAKNLVQDRQSSSVPEKCVS